MNSLKKYTNANILLNHGRSGIHIKQVRKEKLNPINLNYQLI